MSRRWIFMALLCSLAPLALGGCTAGAIVGPPALGGGRPAYNAMISKTEDEQSLTYIVDMRYGYSRTLMAVSSITANVRFAASLGAEVGVGPERNFAGNLVPLSGGVAYEGNPTISYLPLQGDKQLRQALSPIPLDLLVLLFNESTLYKGPALTMLVERINGAKNPDFPVDPDAPEIQRFRRLAAVVGELGAIDAVQFVQGSGDDKAFYFWLHDYAPSHLSQAGELLDLLGIEGVSAAGNDVLLPVALAPRPASRQSIALQTRSVNGLARVAAMSVEVPEEDGASGLALNVPHTGPASEMISIRRASERPANAYVAIRYRDWWYYIDGTDTFSKAYFRNFQALLSVQIAEATSGLSKAPVLTVPVN